MSPDVAPPENRPAEEAPRVSSGRFAPGVSGNPGGRSKAMTDVRKAIEARGPELVATLMSIALPPEPPAEMSAKDLAALLARRSSDQLKALELLFAYWLGRPTASVEVSSPEGVQLHVPGIREAAVQLLSDPDARKALRAAMRERERSEA